LRGQDLNLRPSGYEPDELPGCSTPRLKLALLPDVGFILPEVARTVTIHHPSIFSKGFRILSLFISLDLAVRVSCDAVKASMPISRVAVRVPASTSNLGPGFDCLGLALQLYNTITLTRSDTAKFPQGMMGDAATAFFQKATGGKIAPFGFDVQIDGEIPISRGLGSSVTVRLGILMGLAELVRDTFPVTREQLLTLLVELEGHPDNAVPSFLGGFAVCAHASADSADGFVFTRALVKPELAFITLVPDLRLSTEIARGLLPKAIPFRHAVENVQRTARIAAAFCTGDYAALRGMFVDHLHQPYRQVLIPGFTAILSAAQEAGALGSFLSGAGSCLMALTLDNVEAISSAMMEAAKKHDLPARVLILKADNEGAQVIEKAH
jgi:homoserine kinase